MGTWGLRRRSEDAIVPIDHKGLNYDDMIYNGATGTN